MRYCVAGCGVARCVIREIGQERELQRESVCA